MNNPLKKNEIHISELDGLRGIAIIIVVFFHYWTMAIVPFGKASKLIIGFSSLFWSGVDLFFVLSGFLIGGILIRNRTSPNYFKTFYIRRFTRIFPIYFLSLALFFICSSIPFFMQIPDLINSPIPIWQFNTCMVGANLVISHWRAILSIYSINCLFFTTKKIALFYNSPYYNSYWIKNTFWKRYFRFLYSWQVYRFIVGYFNCLSF